MTHSLDRQTRGHFMLDTADQFFRAAERCHERFSSHPTRAWLPYPQVANYAFAAEVALKGLQVVYLGNATRGHHLERLYRTLPENVQSRVSGTAAQAVLLHERLGEISLAFETWRYAYEHNMLGISLDLISGLAQRAMGVLQDEVGPLSGHSPS
jgi:hypothetical protein